METDIVCLLNILVLNLVMVHSSSSSDQSRVLQNSHFGSYGNLVSQNMIGSGEVNNVVLDNMTSPDQGSLVTDTNSGLSGGTPSLKRSASINADSYMRLPASPLSFTSNNVSGSSIIDVQSPVQQGIYQGASTATSLPNPRIGQGSSMFHGVFGSEQDNLNLSHVQKKPRFDIKQDDMLQQLALKQMLQRQDSMNLPNTQNSNLQFQALYKQRQFLQSLPPAQRVLFLQQQQQPQSRQNIQQQMSQPAPAVNQPYEGGVCARKMSQYLFHLRQRPADINYWRKFVNQYYSPHAKQRWCLSGHSYVGNHPSGVFPPANSDIWQCSICGSKSGKGFEATFEVLPRLNEIKFSSGVIEEQWSLGLPRECRFPSGIMMVEYENAVQQSVYEQLRVVHEGRLKVVFTRELKILSWEFCSRRHEEFIPRRLVAPQVSQMLEVAQQWQSKIAESGSGEVSQQDLQASSNMLVTAGRQLARSLDMQSLNDLGFSKRHVRSLQIAEVVTSMKDLIDYTVSTNTGPLEAMKRFYQQASVAKMQRQKMQRMEQMSSIQGVPNDRNALSGLVALQSGLNSSISNNIHAGNRGALALLNYQSTLMRQSLMNSNSGQEASPSFSNMSSFQGQNLQNNNSNISVGYQRFPSGVIQVQQSQNQQVSSQGQQNLQNNNSNIPAQAAQHHMMQQVHMGMNDNNSGGGAKPSVSGQSVGGPARSDSFKGGSHSDSCAGGEKVADLPHVSDIFQDIVSEFTENGFFTNDEPGWKA